MKRYPDTHGYGSQPGYAASADSQLHGTHQPYGYVRPPIQARMAPPATSYAPSAGYAPGNAWQDNSWRQRRQQRPIDASAYGIIEDDGRPSHAQRQDERPSGSTAIEWAVGLLLLAGVLTFMLWITWLLFG